MSQQERTGSSVCTNVNRVHDHDPCSPGTQVRKQVHNHHKQSYHRPCHPLVGLCDTLSRLSLFLISLVKVKAKAGEVNDPVFRDE